MSTVAQSDTLTNDQADVASPSMSVGPVLSELSDAEDGIYRAALIMLEHGATLASYPQSILSDMAGQGIIEPTDDGYQFTDEFIRRARYTMHKRIDKITAELHERVDREALPYVL